MMLRPDASRELRVDAPLNIRRILGVYYGSRDPTCWLDRDALWRSYRTVDGPATLRVRSRTRHDNSYILTEAWGPGALALIKLAPQLLGVRDDPSKLQPQHDIIRDLHRRHTGLRISSGMPVMDVLIPTILGQRVKGSEAADSYRAMCFALGGLAPGPRRLQLPPDPRKLARMAPWLLHRFGVEHARAFPIVHCCARADRLQDIHRMTATTAFSYLQRLQGVGPWTAALTVIATHGWTDGVVRGDYHLPHTVSWGLAGEPRGDDDRMVELLEPYIGQRWRVVLLLQAGHIQAPRRGPRRANWRDAVELATSQVPSGSSARRRLRQRRD